MKKTKFKYENVVFIVLITTYIVGALVRNCNLISNVTTLTIQLFMCVGVRTTLKYIRKNSDKVQAEIKDLLSE